MKNLLTLAVFFMMVSSLAWGQQPTFHDQLLDHFAGTWVLRGTIAGKETTHDVSADWVLGHQYMRIHEVSREKDSHGQPAYDAMVFVGWDQSAAEYVCIWLDTYGGMNATSMGRAKRAENLIHFTFQDKNSVFHTQFIYHPDARNWEWRLDSEEKGGTKPFARVKLTAQ